jgi:hypothetical protein
MNAQVIRPRFVAILSILRGQVEPRLLIDVIHWYESAAAANCGPIDFGRRGSGHNHCHRRPGDDDTARGSEPGESQQGFLRHVALIARGCATSKLGDPTSQLNPVWRAAIEGSRHANSFRAL